MSATFDEDLLRKYRHAIGDWTTVRSFYNTIKPLKFPRYVDRERIATTSRNIISMKEILKGVDIDSIKASGDEKNLVHFLMTEPWEIVSPLVLWSARKSKSDGSDFKSLATDEYKKIWKEILEYRTAQVGSVDIPKSAVRSIIKQEKKQAEIAAMGPVETAGGPYRSKKPTLERLARRIVDKKIANGTFKATFRGSYAGSYTYDTWEKMSKYQQKAWLRYLKRRLSRAKNYNSEEYMMQKVNEDLGYFPITDHDILKGFGLNVF